MQYWTVPGSQSAGSDSSTTTDSLAEGSGLHEKQQAAIKKMATIVKVLIVNLPGMRSRLLQRTNVPSVGKTGLFFV